MADTHSGERAGSGSSFCVLSETETGQGATSVENGRSHHPQQGNVMVSAMARDNIPRDVPEPFPMSDKSGSDMEVESRSSLSLLRKKVAISAARRQGTIAHHGSFRDAIDPRSILTKTMLDPPPTYNNGYGTEYASNGAMIKLGAQPAVDAKPASWPDPFVSSMVVVTPKTEGKYIYDAEFKLPTTWVHVTHDSTYVDEPELSHLGLAMMQASATAITDRTLQASATWQTPRFPDFGALTYLMSSYMSCKGGMSQDAAPLLRCGLMMMSFAGEEVTKMMTSVSQAFDFGNTPCDVCEHKLQDVTKCTASKLYIPHTKGTSNIHFITVKSYVDIICDSRQTDPYDTTVNQQLLKTAVVVPLKMVDLHADYLIPYVASFTSTHWWNGASYYELKRTDGFGSLHTRYVGSSKACMTVVAGAYKHVVCVVMDAGSGEVRNAQFGTWTSSDTSKYCAEGAKEIYTWLGMYGEGEHPSRDTMMAAYHRICEVVGTTDVMARVEFMLAELSFSLPMGFTVRTEKTSNSKMWYGPTSTGGVMKIASKDIPVLADGTDVKQSAALQRLWCVSPLGLFTMSRSDYEARERTKEGHVYEEMRLMTGPLNVFNQYTVTENPSMVRLLVAADAFTDALHCENTHKSVKADYWPLEIQYKAAFVSLIAGWWFLESGLPITDFNGISETDWKSVQNYKDVMSVMTCGFVSRVRGARRLIDDSEVWKKVVKKALGMEEWQVGFEGIWSLHVPFWGIKAVMEKLGYNVPCRFTAALGMFAKGTGWNGAFGHKVDSNTDEKMPWYKLAALTSTLNYEVGDTQQGKYFSILVLDREKVHVVPTLTGWFPHCRVDAGKTWNGHSDAYYEDSPEGVVELLAIVNPYHRVVLDASYPQMYVDEKNRVNERYVPDADPMSVDLTQPDPITDWLYSGLLKVAPHLVMGDIPGAVIAGAEHVISSAMDWVKGRFRFQQREPWDK